MEWTGPEQTGHVTISRKGKDRNGPEWHGMEWNGMERNGKERTGHLTISRNRMNGTSTMQPVQCSVLMQLRLSTGH